MNQLQQRQSGFTLVEIAIVLVIIGLLLGGVLKGQELINSAKVKNMVGDFRTVSSMVYGYQDRFKAFPGDQTQAQLDLALGAGVATACTPAAAGLCAQNNGRIDGAWVFSLAGKPSGVMAAFLCFVGDALRRLGGEREKTLLLQVARRMAGRAHHLQATEDFGEPGAIGHGSAHLHVGQRRLRRAGQLGQPAQLGPAG